MNKNAFMVVIIILLVIGGFLIINNSHKTASTQKTSTISAKISAAGRQLIDVRTPEEYIAGHAKGAINIPLATIQRGDFSKISKTKPIYVYCNSGIRAGEAQTILEQNGYKNVTNLGGLKDWQAQGGVVCKSTRPTC